MTPEAAIYGFFSGFNMPAYAAASTPSDAEFPYITYDLAIGGWEQGEVNVTANLWYLTDSEAEPNAKVREISSAIGIGGVTLPCDGGMLWIKKGSPFAQALTIDGENKKIKRRYINLDIEYLLTE